MTTQIRYSFDKTTLVKIVKGALIAGGAVVALYILEALTAADFGIYTPTAVAVLSILINVVKEYIQGQKRIDE
jgi:hypothetical protein